MNTNDSVWAQCIKAKAKEYNIPAEIGNSELHHLLHLIEDWEKLLDQAEDLSVEWDATIYDVCGLLELIEEKLEEQMDLHNQYINDLNFTYAHSRGV